MRDLSRSLSDCYPGRAIIVGSNPQEHAFALYIVTGRSAASKARKLAYAPSHSAVEVLPIDEKALHAENADLLIYEAIRWIPQERRCVVSNGNQTKDIVAAVDFHDDPVDILRDGLSEWSFEPDAPHYTPRINACLDDCLAACSIIKRGEEGSAERNFFHFELKPGQGKFIATYNGMDSDPLQSFLGEPEDIAIPWCHVSEAVEAIQEKISGKYRVATAGISIAGTEVIFAIQNRLEKTLLNPYSM